jgi:hypothetical protein
MRVGFTPKDGDPALPEAHAGDEVSILAEGRLPMEYKNRAPFGACVGREVAKALARASDKMFSNSPQTAATPRAMLLGDRSFVDRAEAVDVQKTGTFHVLVVAELHVGALAVFLVWASRKMRFAAARADHRHPDGACGVHRGRRGARAGLMAAIVVLGSFSIGGAGSVAAAGRPAHIRGADLPRDRVYRWPRGSADGPLGSAIPACTAQLG